MFHGTYMKKLEDNSSLMVIWMSGNQLYYSWAIHVSVISGTVRANCVYRTQGCQLRLPDDLQDSRLESEISRVIAKVCQNKISNILSCQIVELTYC